MARPEPDDIDADRNVSPCMTAVGGRFRIAGSRSPSTATRISPNQIASRSRSAISPTCDRHGRRVPIGHPRPATAVLTSGRIGYRKRDAFGGGISFRALDRHLDHLGAALGVAPRPATPDHGSRSRAGTEPVETRGGASSTLGLGRRPRRTGRKQHQRVGGGRVAVDRHRIEGGSTPP